jgi:hypothetical protein
MATFVKARTMVRGQSETARVDIWINVDNVLAFKEAVELEHLTEIEFTNGTSLTVLGSPEDLAKLVVEASKKE